MSNSDLVSYVKISPNKTSTRNKMIDTLTIHCTAGECTVESLGNIFAKPSRRASSNYGVDKNGRIGLYVEEKDRSWCSSNAANDNRAITIEVSTEAKEPYKCTDAALNSLIDLCVDICKRNGKKKLIWFNNKERTLAYEPKSDEMVMTVHRWFSNKSCPGEYLYGKHGWIAYQVNQILERKEHSKINTKMSNKDIFDYLVSSGLTPAGAAGLMGNLEAESGIRANNLQNSYENVFGLDDETYTAAVNSGAYSKEAFVHDKAGYGIAQWTFWSRKKALYEYAESIHHEIDSMEMQVKFLLDELVHSYRKVYNVLSTSTSIKECSDCVLTQFEKPKNQSDEVKKKRYEYSKELYSQLDSYKEEIKACPFLIRVKDRTVKIRYKESVNATVTGCVTNGAYTVIEVKAGIGSNLGWGKLKSGLGWINLDEVEII